MFGYEKSRLSTVSGSLSLKVVLTLFGILLMSLSPQSSLGIDPATAAIRQIPYNPDPIAHLPAKVQAEFACISYAESRNQLVDTNVSSGTQGKWQFQVWLWQYARGYIKGLPPTPNQATELQQDQVAVFFYTRNGGFYPEWSSDSQCLK